MIGGKIAGVAARNLGHAALAIRLAAISPTMCLRRRTGLRINAALQIKP
jgi:hypothetical protein